MACYLYQPTVLPLLAAWLLLGTCHSFSFDISNLVARTANHGAIQRDHLPRPSSSLYYSTILPRSSRSIKTSPLTIRWNTPTESSAQSTVPAATEDSDDLPITPTSIDLHPPTLQAVAQALLIRAQNTPDMPLRYVDDGKMEPWEITLAAGKVAQRAAEELQQQLNLNPQKNEKDEEVMQVMAGRVVAVLTRLEELEEELLNRCCKLADDGCECLGVPDAELKAWQSNNSGDDDDATKQRTMDAAAAIDAACLFDPQLRFNRARSLLAMFLHEIEGPGLRRNNVVIPCMDVNFLPQKEWGMLLVNEDDAKTVESEDNSSNDELVELEDRIVDYEPEARPSLHPITIDAIEEAFRLRAQNSTTSPLRLIDQQTEWFEVQYSIVKFADRFLEKYTKPSISSKSSSSNDDDEHQWTQEELETIGGRIVGVLMRLDDLEWEWHHRCSTSTLAEANSPSLIAQDMWKTTLGLHPNNVEQTCFRTVDVALLEEKKFARARAEKMLALFLMNIEAPGLKAAGNKVPGGSYPDFIDDDMQLELMMPRPRKEE